MKNIQNLHVKNAIGIIQNGEILFLMDGDVVNIITDDTDFEKEYKEVAVDVTVDGLFLQNNEELCCILFEYIKEIELVLRDLEA